MRILMLNHNVAHGGGTFQRAFNLAKRLAPRGHDVTLLSIAPRARWRFQEQQRDGVRVVSTPDLLGGIGRTGWDPWDTLRRVGYLWSRSFDVIYAFDSRPAVVVPALFAQRKHGLPLVMDWADWWGKGGAIGERPFGWINRVVGPFEAWLEEASRPFADHTTVISRALEGRARALGLDPVRYVPNGCNVEVVSPVDRARARAQLGIPLERPLLGHLGVPYPADAELMGEAMTLLQRRRPDLQLVILGDLRNPKLEALVQRYWPDPSARLSPGFVPDADLSLWLGVCDAVLLPLTDTVANRGRSPGKVTDYLAAGRPIVATPVGDMTDLVGNAEAGLLAEPTPQAFAAAAERLLDDPALGQRLGQNGRALATGRLAWSEITSQVEDVLAQTCAALDRSARD